MGTVASTMAFVRLGGRTIAYGRGDRKDLDPPVVYQAPAVDLDTPLRNEIALLRQQNSGIQAEIDELKRKKANHKFKEVDNGLGPEFDFGRRVFECKIDPPGVGYRNTPEFSNKNTDGTGPQAPDLVIADAICQGPRAIFIREAESKLWLPLTDPKGERVCFEHKGRDNEFQYDPARLTKRVNKLSPAKADSWFSPVRDPKQG